MTGKNPTAITTPPPAAVEAGSNVAPGERNESGAKSDMVEKGDMSEKSVLSEHKGKLAIGVAATLGLMIYYNWRQKNLPKEDPEAYARLQRLKDSIKAQIGNEKQAHNGKPRKPSTDK